MVDPNPKDVRDGEGQASEVVEGADEPQTASPGGTVLKGTSVAPGLVLGPVHRKDYDLFKDRTQRVPLDQVERELNRFHRALTDSRGQLEDLKQRLAGRVPADHVRILDTHIAYLKDSVFLSDVENLILNEQMGLSAAIGKVIADFDRIFRLVDSETLRDRAVDLRDVGIRVLRNLERAEGASETDGDDNSDYVLVARELSIVDMFNLSNEHVLGIVTEEGGLTSHAAILARSMRIPTLTGVEGLLEAVNEGDVVIVDAAEGIVRVNPDEVVRAQYAKAREEYTRTEDTGVVPEWASGPVKTVDGETILVTAACGNLPEVEQGISFGLTEIGLYRTELLYLIDRDPPSLESLIAHYASVLEQAGDAPVTFRLLHVDSSLEVPYLHEHRELNPGLGRAGVRILLARDAVLRRQCQAILRAAADREADVRIAVPFVIDCGEFRRVKEILFEERYAMRKAGDRYSENVDLGVVVDTPVAALGARDLAREADFLVLGLDSLMQYLLAADRENHELGEYFEPLHPFALRTIGDLASACEDAGRPLSVFGVSAVSQVNLPFLLGVGLRHFCVPPVALREFVEGVRRVELDQARKDAELAARATCQAETQSLVDGYRHGFARP